MKTDYILIIAALLHDVPEDNKKNIKKILRKNLEQK